MTTVTTSASFSTTLNHGPALSNNTLVSLSGVAVSLTPLSPPSSPSFAWGPGTGTGLTAFAAHPHLDLLAYASASSPPSVYVLSLPSLSPLAVLALDALSPLPVWSLAFSPSGSVLAVVTTPPDPTLMLYEWATGECLASLPLPLHTSAQSPPPVVHFAPNETLLAVVGYPTPVVLRYAAFAPFSLRLASVGTGDLLDGLSVLSALFVDSSLLVLGTEEGALLALTFHPKAPEKELPTLIELDHAVESEQGGVRALALAGATSHDDNNNDEYGGRVVEIYTGGADGVLRTFNLGLGGEPSASVSGLHAMPSASPVAHIVANDNVLVVVSQDGETYMKPRGGDEFELLSHAHTQPVTAMAPFPTTHMVALGSGSGEVRVWNYASSVLLTKFMVPEPVSRIAHAPGAPLLAVASYNGVVRVYDVSGLSSSMPNPARLIWRVRVSLAPITCLAWGSTELLCVGSLGGRVAWMDGVSGALESHFETKVPLVTGSPAGPDAVLLVTGPGNMLLVTPESSSGSSGPQLEVHPDFPVLDCVRGGPTSSSVFALAQDGGFKTYQLPSANTDITPASAAFPGHAKPGGVLSLSPNGEWVGTGGADGALMIRSASSPGSSPISLLRHSPVFGGVSALAWSFDSQYLISAGIDGGVFAFVVSYKSWWSLPETELELPEGVVGMPTVENDARPHATELDVLAASALAAASEEALAKDATMKNREDRVATLCSRFMGLIEANSQVLPIEQLKPDEFIIDFDAVAAYRRSASRDAYLAHERQVFANLSVDAATDAIIAECWEGMAEVGFSVSAFLSGLEVAGYPIRKSSPKEDRAGSIARALRRVEMDAEAAVAKEAENAAAAAAAAAALSSPANNSLAPGYRAPGSPLSALRRGSFSGGRRRASVISLSSPGLSSGGAGGSSADMWSSFDVESEYSGDEGGDGRRRGGGTGGGRKLMYTQLDVTTRNRRVTQIQLLKSQIRNKKRRFNTEARRVLGMKKSVISGIEERNDRIRDILSELGLEECVEALVLTSAEVPASVLSVKDEEMGIERFIPPEELAAQEAARAEEEARLLLERGDDSGERALDEMMFGRVEDRGLDSLQVSLERPEWMNKPSTELTEDEVKAVKEFEARVQEAEEEAQKYRRALETELKKLRSANAEAIGSFDVALAELFNGRLRADMSIMEDELRMVTLSRDIVAEEVEVEREAELSLEIDLARQEQAGAEGELNDALGVLQDARARYDECRAAEVGLEREFRAAVAGEEFWRKSLYEFFKAKRGEDDGMREGVGPEVWAYVLEMRERRMGAESKVKSAGNLVARVNALVSECKAAVESGSDRVEAGVRALKDWRDSIDREHRNLEIQLTLKQGQQEGREGVVMIERQLVEHLNEGILDLGNKRLGILERIKAVRGKVSNVEWELERLQFICDQVSDEIREFQLLRVTKELQELIKGSDRRATEVAGLENRLAAAAAAHESKKEELQAKLRRVRGSIARVRAENAQLESQQSRLASGVQERRLIASHVSFGPGGGSGSGGGGVSASRKRELRVRRKAALRDGVKKREEELVVLREELDRVRAGVWPRL